jgi:hypothetical protein
MTTFDDQAFIVMGRPGDWKSDAEFWARTDPQLDWAPPWGFLTWGIANDPRLKIGGQFGGWFYGVRGNGGMGVDMGPQDTAWPPGMGDTSFKTGPNVNDYSNFAGVLGTGIFVTGVAGTSVNTVGVYGQAEEDAAVPQFLPAGVVGAANTGPGVVAWSNTWNGVEGWAYQGTALLGVSDSGYGVHGASSTQPGAFGFSDYDSGVLGVSGDYGPIVPNPSLPNVAGVIGSSYAQPGMIGTSKAHFGVYGFSNDSVGVVGHTAQTGPNTYAGYFVGNLYVSGQIFAGVKDAMVPFPDGSKRVLHCMESPEHWFEDFGAAKLKRGRAVVKLDADFAKVITRGDYNVFLTPEGDCRGLYVRRKSAASFEVRELMGGKSAIAFSYRIVGRRKDIKGHRRFAKIDPQLALPAPARARRKAAPTAAGLRSFAARAEKAARARRRKGVEAELRAFAARARKVARTRRPKSA